MLLSCICGMIFIVIIFTNQVIGTINFNLNFKKSLHRELKIKGPISYLIPKSGFYRNCAQADGANYKIYCCTVIFTTIHYALIAITLTLLLILYFLSVDGWWSVIFVPAVYLIAVIIAGTVIVKKAKTNPNTLH